jgi:phage-related protein (TIGR01555 family)
MSRKHQIKARAAQVNQQTDVARKSFMTGDSFQNFTARVGLGTANQNSGSSYGFTFVSRNRIQMEAVYRSSWLAGRAVDCRAKDMTREGIEFNSVMPPEEKDKLSRAFERLQIWKGLCDNEKWSRLYGGSIAVMLIDGQRPDTPLRLDSIGRGQFKGLLVLDRWLVQPSLENLVTEYGPDLGKPKYYTVVADAQALINQKIHYSRVIRREGVELPYWQRIAENGWGQSVLERLWDRLIAFDSVTSGTSQLVYKAHLRTYSVKGLRELIATGGRTYEALLKQIDMIRALQSNEGLTLMDAEDEFETHQYSFSGLAEVIDKFGEQVCGAVETPDIILFGQSPGGLSNGDESVRIYYDGIKADQDSALRPGVTTLCDVIARSELGKPLPEGFAFDFVPLWQLSDTEKADVGAKDTASVVEAFDAGIVDRGTALKELRQSSNTTGLWSNITDDEIKAAEDEQPPVPGEGDKTDDPPGNSGQEAKPESGKDEPS